MAEDVFHQSVVAAAERDAKKRVFIMSEFQKLYKWLSRLQILKISFLRNILIISFLIAAVLPICDILLIHPSFTKLLATSTKEEAVRVARSLKSLIIADRPQLFRKSLPIETLNTISRVKDDFGLMKLKIFSGSGEIIYSTDAGDIGEINPKKYFHDVLAKGKIYTKFVPRGTESLEDQKVTADVVETYIPILGEQNKFLGAFEIYYDISSRKQTLDRLLFISSLLLFGLPISLLSAIIVVLNKAGKTIAQREQAEEELKRHRNHLEDLVDERTAELMRANVNLRREIDSRIRAEDALKESESRLRFLSSHLLSAQERERRRISLELHDEMGQALTVMKLHVRSIEEQLGENQRRLKGECEETLEHVDQIIESVRRLSRDLSPSILEDLGLTAALRWLIEDSATHFNYKVSTQIADIDDLFPLESQIIIYRIFQEAFTNIGKHAQATHIKVVIKKENGGVSFLVEDNGAGFDIRRMRFEYPARVGLGLAAMDERTRMLGGHLEIWSQENKGTRISFSVSFGNGGGG